MKAFLCHGYGLAQCLILGSVQVAARYYTHKSHDSSSICASLQVVKYTTTQRFFCDWDKSAEIEKMCYLCSFSSIFFVSGTLNTNVSFYHVKYPEVKTGCINIVGLFAAAPQFIQTSVAIETGLVFLSALQLEESGKKAQNIHGCALLCVCISMCV